MTARTSARAIAADLEISPRRVAAAVALGTLALGSAVGLAATAAWLIAKAAQLPSPAELAVAATIVRTLGIGRGVFRYLERLSSHDTALRGMAALRATTYRRLSVTAAARALSLRRGDIVARTGADMDTVGDAVVRTLVPLAVAATVSAVSVGIVAAFHLGAAGFLAVCLVGAIAIPALLTARQTRISEERGVAANAAVSAAALEFMDGAPEHQVWGTSDKAARRLAAASAELDGAREDASKPAALAAAAQTLIAGIALVGGVWIATAAVAAGALGPTGSAVVALTPLAAFEAAGAVPAAVQQWARTRAAARRIDAMVAEASEVAAAAPAAPGGPAAADASVELRGLSAGWPGATPTAPVSARVAPGEALAIIGPSGIGKTTMLLTIAGALRPHAGQALVGGVAVHDASAGPIVAVTAEDAHVFGTSLLENLRVARGDVTRDEATAALATVGLDEWLADLPDGLDTELGTGGLSVSGGERRRLLLARAMLHRAPVVLIDEPAEHLDDRGAAALRDMLARLRAERRTAVIVTHDHTLLDLVDVVVELDAANATTKESR